MKKFPIRLALPLIPLFESVFFLGAKFCHLVTQKMGEAPKKFFFEETCTNIQYYQKFFGN
jgi:hypothetical protein